MADSVTAQRLSANKYRLSAIPGRGGFEFVVVEQALILELQHAASLSVTGAGGKPLWSRYQRLSTHDSIAAPEVRTATSMAAIIQVQDLVKHYEVPVREGGLLASMRSVVRRRHRTVRAVEGSRSSSSPAR